jgi:ribokinase
MNSKKITVVGSINVDLVINSDRMPLSGETIEGGGFQVISGGKGANQAVAVSRQGTATSFIGCTGDDDFGNSQKANLSDEKINTDLVSQVKGESTGVAVIIVEPDGNNRIILSPGANHKLTPDDIKDAEKKIAEADILICQLETPLETIKKALETAKANNTITILNPAPAVILDPTILSLVDYLIPNETEAEVLSGLKVKSIDDAKLAAKKISETCPGTIIITMGEAGVLTLADGKMDFAKAFPVKARDTTAAGDTFIGTLAAFLVQGNALGHAVEKAMAAAAISVTRVGAQTSIPDKNEFEAFYLKQQPDMKK